MEKFKLTINTVIIIVTAVIFLVSLITLINSTYYNLAPLIILEFLVGFFLAFLLTLFLPYKILKYATYTIFSLLVLLSIYHIIKVTYWNYSFYGYYTGIDDFLYKYPLSTHNLLIIKIFRELRIFLLAELDFISFAAGLILPAAYKIFNAEKKEV